MITIWTWPGSARHCALCDAFLDACGFIVIHDALHRVVTMETPPHIDRTCWRLVAAASAGMA